MADQQAFAAYVMPIYQFPNRSLCTMKAPVAQPAKDTPTELLASMICPYLRDHTLREITEHKDYMFAIADAIGAYHDYAVTELERANGDQTPLLEPAQVFAKLDRAKHAATKVFATQNTFRGAITKLREFVHDVLSESRFRVDPSVTAVYKYRAEGTNEKERNIREMIRSTAEPVVGPAFAMQNVSAKDELRAAAQGYIGELRQRYKNLVGEMGELKEMVNVALREAQGHLSKR
ncbi:hypothetical protein BDV96DRAFT_604088 [Lophiotrema nucula]|uniref:Uncharacterized protein n=1 Tax=Lophiotrema nucula TaxID=690887 RepID=A0A6A5YTK7_9PLEO|nr:hypothetical protein BDV96DRAFT_604088 [Lophiotrema nucula]